MTSEPLSQAEILAALRGLEAGDLPTRAVIRRALLMALALLAVPVGGSAPEPPPAPYGATAQ